MVVGMVLDIETRLGSGALRATRRVAAPRGMPPGLQNVAAVAMLDFAMDEKGVCDGLTLTSIDRTRGGERTIVGTVERRLGELADSGGTLITFNGSHDLGILRLAAARHRLFDRVASMRWLRGIGLLHEDLMLEYESSHRSWPRLDDLAASFGLTTGREVLPQESALSTERMKCELDVIFTMALYLHLVSERQGSGEPLRHGVLQLRALMASRMRRAPHFHVAMGAPAFAITGAADSL